MFNKVDLPQPEGPMMATNSPSLISNETPFNARVSMSSVRKIFTKFSTLIMMLSFKIIIIVINLFSIFVKFVILVIHYFHSFFNAVTGFTRATETICHSTEPMAMTIDNNAARAKIHQ